VCEPGGRGGGNSEALTAFCGDKGAPVPDRRKSRSRVSVPLQDVSRPGSTDCGFLVGKDTPLACT